MDSSHNMVSTDVPRLQFVLHASGAPDLLPIVQRERETVTFLLFDMLRKDTKSAEYLRTIFRR